jgi:lysophospholipase L1-like esterase
MDDNKKPYRPLLPRLLLALIAVLITIGAIELAGRLTSGSDKLSIINNLGSLKPSGNPAGYKLREAAWEASFIERHLKVPPGGPREGLRGEGVTPLKCAVSDCNFRKSVPGIIEVNDDGLQTAGEGGSPYPHILIVGGSVAWGAGASDIANAYFSILYEKLKNEYPDTEISVLAAYGSTSNTDLSSFVRKGLDAKPDVVVFINGLNDLTVKGQLRQTDASDYILNMKTAAWIAERNGIPVVVVRQPFPGGKKFKTDLEKRIMELSNKDYEKVITPLYKHIGKVLEEMAKAGEIYYIDAADCFQDETATTFNDQWHFSDPGHKLLAERIHAGLAPIMNEILGNNGDNPD